MLSDISEMQKRSALERMEEHRALRLLPDSDRMAKAFEQGNHQGLMDQHWTRDNYATGEEWLEHLRGWREGQAEIMKAWKELE